MIWSLQCWQELKLSKVKDLPIGPPLCYLSQHAVCVDKEWNSSMNAMANNEAEAIEVTPSVLEVGPTRLGKVVFTISQSVN